MGSGIRLAGWLREAAGRLGSRLEAEVLAGHALGRGRGWLYANGDHIPDRDQVASLNHLLERRLGGEPIAYLVGRREFFGREFVVSPAVLIPRPETEELVAAALALELPADARVLDLGTGSGCIALSLAAERPDWRIMAVDLSTAALEIAAANRAALGLERVRLAAGDLFDPVDGERFDLVVSNPPYVAAGDHHLERGDLRFEPRAALETSDAAGLEVIRRIIDRAPDHLASAGWLILEHGFDQARAVSALLAGAGWQQIESRHDLAGHPRITLARRPAVK